MEAPIRRRPATGLAPALVALAWLALAVPSPAAAAGCRTPVDALPGNRDPVAVAPLAKPALGASGVDAVHGTCVARLTDHAALGAGRFARTIYSRSQAFSADGSRALVYLENGAWHTVDADTGADLGRVPGIVGAGAEPQWDATDPDLLHFLDDGGGPALRRANVRTGALDTVADFAGRLGLDGAARVSTGSSGSPSADQRWWAFAAESASGRPLGIVVWDRSVDRIVARLDFAAAGLPPTDTVSMSPSGRHVVAEWPAPTGVRVFARDLSGPGARLNTSPEHSDLARLAGGADAYVSVDFDATGQVYYVDLDAALAAPEDPGAGRVDLFEAYPGGSIHSMHFSGKAFDRPGWALVSTYAPRRLPDGDPPWLYARLVAVELAPGGRTLGIAHARVRPLGPDEGKVYFAEPHGTVSRDFARVAWNSNWGASDALDVDAYAVGLDWGDAVPESPCAAGAARRTVAPDRWTLLGLPCRVPPGTDVAALFGDDVDGAYGTDWTLFRFDAAAGAYVEPGANDPAPEPGKGFWFIHTSAGARTLDLPAGSEPAPASGGNGCAAGAGGCLDAPLSGRTSPTPWNLVASPAMRAAPVRELRLATSDGPCSGAEGCTLERAAADGALAGTPFRHAGDGPGRGYVPLVAGAAPVEPWEGLWLALGDAARDRAPTLRVPAGRRGTGAARSRATADAAR